MCNPIDRLQLSLTSTGFIDINWFPLTWVFFHLCQKCISFTRKISIYAIFFPFMQKKSYLCVFPIHSWIAASLRYCFFVSLALIPDEWLTMSYSFQAFYDHCFLIALFQKIFLISGNSQPLYNRCNHPANIFQKRSS